jgi:phosphopantothenoylcysteine decarboxylase/phosphopantothenate--cysteine ligase
MGAEGTSGARHSAGRTARVLVGVTGSIAAYKACELVRLLVRDGHEVVPLTTPGAERFVARETFEALARREAPRELYPHLLEADLLVVAPLSANTLAKLAHGLADTVLTEAALAFRGLVLLAPAMNTRMWEHPATQANVRMLVERGAQLVGPHAGELAEGEVGAGRMAEPEEIAARVREALAGAAAGAGSLAGRRVLVTAGGTREPLDGVRFVGNRSSGRMGVALAAEAAARGADVTLLAANLAVPPPAGVTVVETPTAADLAREALARGAHADVVLMAAAVADYRPADPTEAKRPKDAEPWTVTLEPTQDVLAELGRRKRNGQVIVGFAADQGEHGLERAREKLARKNGTLFVFNDVSRDDIGFDSELNEVTVVSRNGEQMIGKRDKRAIAAAILGEVATLLEGGRS